MKTAATVKEVIARVFCFLASRKPSGMKNNSKFIIVAKRKPVPMFHAKTSDVKDVKTPSVASGFYKWISGENSYILYSSHVKQKYFKPFSGLVLMIVVLLFIFCHGPWV